jgi:4-hydroxybenzoate polyprenyltransferase
MDARHTAPTIPLVIDLDGTLTPTDTLWEGFFHLFRRSPLRALATALRLFRGKWAFKERLAVLTPEYYETSLPPLRDEVVSFATEEKNKGRRVVLATASHEDIARRIAGKIGIFDEVIGSRGRINLKGTTKARRLAELYGHKGFDYIGNCKDDWPVWRESNKAYVAGNFRGNVRQEREVKLIPISGKEDGSSFYHLLKAARPQQWLKNLLVFAPMIASHQYLNVHKWVAASEAFICFGLCASASYLLNDLLDAENDRRHPIKKKRAIAGGRVAMPVALTTSVGLFAGGIALAVHTGIVAEIFCYCLTTLAYSVYLKKIPIVDISVLAFLYCLRTVAGGAATNDEVSLWMIAFGGFVFLSLAAIKRQTEITNLGGGELKAVAGRGYNTADARLLYSIGICSACISPLILALYLQSGHGDRFYSDPHILASGCVFVFLWIISLWRDAEQGMIKDEDPLNYALTNAKSLTFLSLFAIVFLLATKGT